MTQTIISICFAGIAALQWYIIGERTVDAVWQWYEFSGYGNEGYTTMNLETVVIGCTASVIMIVVQLALRKFFSASPLASRLNKMAVYSMASGLVWLTVLIASPIAVVLNK